MRGGGWERMRVRDECETPAEALATAACKSTRPYCEQRIEAHIEHKHGAHHAEEPHDPLVAGEESRNRFGGAEEGGRRHNDPY